MVSERSYTEQRGFFDTASNTSESTSHWALNTRSLPQQDGMTNRGLEEGSIESIANCGVTASVKKVQKFNTPANPRSKFNIEYMVLCGTNNSDRSSRTQVERAYIK